MEKKVLAAFTAIHALNVVHGDVRPSNILVSEEGNKVSIIDFEDGQIIAGEDEKKESEISNEMKAVREMLKEIKQDSGRAGCLPLPESDISTVWVSSLEVS